MYLKRNPRSELHGPPTLRYPEKENRRRSQWAGGKTDYLRSQVTTCSQNEGVMDWVLNCGKVS